jgi:hypothetical protein
MCPPKAHVLKAWSTVQCYWICYGPLTGGVYWEVLRSLASAHTGDYRNTIFLSSLFFSVFAALGKEPRASFMLAKYSLTKPHPQSPFFSFSLSDYEVHGFHHDVLLHHRPKATGQTDLTDWNLQNCEAK